MSDDFAECTLADFIRSSRDVFQIALGIQIVHRNAGAGHDVMEMIEEQPLPCQFHVVLRIRPSVTCRE